MDCNSKILPVRHQQCKACFRWLGGGCSLPLPLEPPPLRAAATNAAIVIADVIICGECELHCVSS